jgi:hypothetical protein
VGEVAADAVEELLRVDLAIEVTRLLRPARILAPPRPVAPVGSLVDARHPASRPVREDPVSVLN